MMMLQGLIISACAFVAFSNPILHGNPNIYYNDQSPGPVGAGQRIALPSNGTHHHGVALFHVPVYVPIHKPATTLAPTTLPTTAAPTTTTAAPTTTTAAPTTTTAAPTTTTAAPTLPPTTLAPTTLAPTTTPAAGCTLENRFMPNPMNACGYIECLIITEPWADANGNFVFDQLPRSCANGVGVPATYTGGSGNPCTEIRPDCLVIPVVTPAPATPAPATPAPVVHTPAPVVHTPAPVVHTPAPVVHTPAPVVHTPAPVVHTPAPTPAPTTTLAPTPAPTTLAPTTTTKKHVIPVFPIFHFPHNLTPVISQTHPVSVLSAHSNNAQAHFSSSSAVSNSNQATGNIDMAALQRALQQAFQRKGYGKK